MGLPVIRGDAERCSAHTYIAHFGLDADGNVKVDVNSSEDVFVKLKRTVAAPESRPGEGCRQQAVAGSMCTACSPSRTRQ